MASRKGLLTLIVISLRNTKSLDSLYYNRYDSALMKGGEIDGASILLQMPEEGGNEEPPERHLEEQEASDTRNLSIMWNQGIPNWQGLIHIPFSQSLKLTC